MTSTALSRIFDRSEFVSGATGAIDRDELASARGVGLALVIGLCLWAGLLVMIFV